MCSRERKFIQGVGGETRRKETMWKIRCRWEYTCEVDRPEIGLRSVDWLRIGQFVGCCEHGNEPLGSIECLEFIYYLRNC